MIAAKILKDDGQIVIRTTFRGLTDIEQASDVEIKAQNTFDTLNEIRLGDKMTTDDYKDDPDVETPFPPAYSDEDSGDSPRRPSCNMTPFPTFGCRSSVQYFL